MTAPVDRFASVAPLAIPAGDVELTATYQTSFGGAPVGAERVAIVKTKDGGRVIVAQSAGDPPQPRFASMKLELDAAGNVRTYALEEDGKLATATPAGGKLHVVAAKPSDSAFPADGLLDGGFVSLMTPFFAHTKAAAISTIAAKQLAGDGTLLDVKYTFDRTTTPIKLVVTASGADSPGTLELDDKGFPKRLEVKFSFGTIVIARQ